MGQDGQQPECFADHGKLVSPIFCEPKCSVIISRREKF